MASVWRVTSFKPHPGRLEAFMRDLSRGNNIVKRSGGKLRAWNEVSGPNAGTVAVVIEHSDWKDFGNYAAKLESDSEWQAFLAEINSAKSPNAEMVSSGISVVTSS